MSVETINRARARPMRYQPRTESPARIRAELDAMAELYGADG